MQVRALLSRILGRLRKRPRSPRKPDPRIADPAYNAVVLMTGDGIPVTPIEMRDKVRKSAILAEDFLLEGR